MIRTLTAADADVVARIARAARTAAIPGFPDLHTPAEDLAFYRGEIESSSGAGWIGTDGAAGTTGAVRADRAVGADGAVGTDGAVESSGEVVGFILWRGPCITHLYVRPDRQRRGIGRELLERALADQPGEVRLWTFQANAQAVAFYLGRGFRIIESTDGSGNEEGLPDHLLARPPAPGSPRDR